MKTIIQCIWNNFEGIVSAIALIVSVLSAIIGRHLSRKDMIKEHRADMNKDIYYFLFDIVFEFLTRCSPDFVDDILDSILVSGQNYSEDEYNSEIEKAYVELGKRKQSIRIFLIKIEAYTSPDINGSDKVFEAADDLYNHLCVLLDLYCDELKNAYTDKGYIINSNLLRKKTNEYEDVYYKIMDCIKNSVMQMKTHIFQEKLESKCGQK